LRAVSSSCRGGPPFSGARTSTRRCMRTRASRRRRCPRSRPGCPPALDAVVGAGRLRRSRTGAIPRRADFAPCGERRRGWPGRRPEPERTVAIGPRRAPLPRPPEPSSSRRIRFYGYGIEPADGGFCRPEPPTPVPVSGAALPPRGAPGRRLIAVIVDAARGRRRGGRRSFSLGGDDKKKRDERPPS